MSKHTFAKSFRDLIVYQKSRAVAKTIFQFTKTFPREETYSLTDQIRRSSRSIGAQIAEAWAKRRYPNHFASLIIAAIPTFLVFAFCQNIIMRGIVVPVEK